MARETGHADSQQITDDLRARIKAGEFGGVGAKIPTKGGLQAHYRAKFGGTVALGTITKVIDNLRAEGLVETRQGSGTFISDPGPPKRSAEYTEIMAQVDGNYAEIMARIDGLSEQVEDLRQPLRVHEATQIHDAEAGTLTKLGDQIGESTRASQARRAARKREEAG